MKLGDIQSRSALANPAQIIDEYEGGINAFLDTSKRIKGISTGFLKLDEMTGGLREGELVILAARPAMGKTAFALNIAQHVATNPTQPESGGGVLARNVEGIAADSYALRGRAGRSAEVSRGVP